MCDRPVWTDEARHRLERLPPYAAPLVRQAAEDHAGRMPCALISTGVLAAAGRRGAVRWHPGAERRLARIPGPVRAMARVELERTAHDRGMPDVTEALMDEVKARYFGMAAPMP